MREYSQASRAFLHSLWDGKPEESYLLVWTLHNKKSAWFTSIDAAADYIGDAATDVYIGVGLAGHAYGPQRRCTSEEIIGIGGLWADLDLKSPAHADKPLPYTRDEALALLPGIVTPTYTIATGNGLHIWLMFREPWIFENEAERTEAANLVLRFQTLIARNAAERGWAFERLADLARVLRIPGTFNCKDPSNPKPIKVVNSGPRWNPGELQDLLDELGVEDPALDKVRVNGGRYTFEVRADASLPADVIAALVENDRTFKATWNQRRRNLKDPSPSGYDLALVNMGVVAGLTDQQLVNLMIAWRARHNHPPKLRADYFARTIAKVRTSLSMVEPLAPPVPGSAAVGVPLGGGLLGTAAAVTAAAAAPVLVPEPPPAAEAPPPSPPPPPDFTPLLKNLRGTLKLDFKRILKVRGAEPTYVVELDDGRTVEMGADEFFNQNRFAMAVYAGLDKAVPRFKEAHWRNLLGSLAQLMEAVDRSPELTAEGQIRTYLMSYLAETPFQLDALAKATAMQRWYPVVRQKRVAVSASHLQIYIRLAFRQDLTVRAITALLAKIGAKHYRERIGRSNDQSRWLLPVEEYPPEEYTPQYPSDQPQEEASPP